MANTPPIQPHHPAPERRYLSEHSMVTLYPERDTIATAELTPGS